MSDTYTVRASLDMKSNVPEVMAQMARSFREINDLIKGTQEGIGRFAADLKEMTASTRGGTCQRL
jgi:methyl-accepting chemotaxis protein